MSFLKPFQLLELNVISAQDLKPVSLKMKTYAVVWVHQEHKLTTQVDSRSHNNPTWNDKFVFRVTEEFLRSDTSAITVEIYALNWLRDVQVGSVRILVGNLIPQPKRRPRHRDIGMKFAALQVWRQSGRPKGILNVGVAVLDSSMRSMPLYSQLSSSAVGYRDLHDNLINNPNKDIILDTSQIINNKDYNINPNKPVLLRRTRSDQIEFDKKPTLEEELLQVASEIASSMVSGSEIELIKGKRIKKPGSDTEPVKVGRRGTRSKPSSVLSAASTSDVVLQGPLLKVMNKRANGSTLIASEVENPIKKKGSGERIRKQNGSELGGKSPRNGGKTKDNRNNDQTDPSVKSINEKAVAFRSPQPQIERYIQQLPNNLPRIEFGSINMQFPFLKHRQRGPTIARGKLANGSIVSISDVGPSPSEVAAEVARRRYLMPDEESSIMDEWSLDESVEGLRSKLDRWQLEPPRVLDRGGEHRTYPSSTMGRTEVPSKSGGKHSDASESTAPNGAFTCFSMIFGYECTCVCGKPPASVIEDHPNALHMPLVRTADQLYRATPGRFGATPGRKGTTPGRIGATTGRNRATPGRLGGTPGRLAG